MSESEDRARLLAAARAEFAEHGYREASTDRIAARAGLTPDAGSAAFPGKQALYFAVLAEEIPEPAYRPTARTAGAALGDFARAWLARLPLATDGQQIDTRLDRDLIPEILAGERTRHAYAQLTGLTAIVLGLALEAFGPGRKVRVAEAALTTLHGAARLAAAAPGFGEPQTVVEACEMLAALAPDDRWDPPHLPFVPAAQVVDEPWSPPAVTDALRAEPARLTGDGVVAVLGLHRLAAAEEAVRAAPAGARVTVALVTGPPGDLAPLARLAVTELRAGLRAAIPAGGWPDLQLVHDDTGALAAAAGPAAGDDTTQFAVRISGGRIVARADGYGAGHAAASS